MINDDNDQLKKSNQFDEFKSDIIKSYKKIKNNRKLRKYYEKRYQLFSKFDMGVLLDSESWFSVTPEKIAQHIALKCLKILDYNSNLIIFDVFCGAGGNTIQFANYFQHVYAFDIDYKKLILAHHNASIYCVENKIEFICDNCFNIEKLLRDFKPDVVFMSPPWGGVDIYHETPTTTSNDKKIMKSYDITKFPINLFQLFKCALKLTKNLILLLPRNVNIEQILYLAHPNYYNQNDHIYIEIEQNFLNNKLVCISAYYGNLVNK